MSEPSRSDENKLIPVGMAKVADAAKEVGISSQILFEAIRNDELISYTVKGVKGQLVYLEDVREYVKPKPKN